MTLLRRILAVMVVLFGLLLARAVRSEVPVNKTPVVHLVPGDTVPYAGDLIQPVTLMTLAAEHKQLRTYKRKLANSLTLREQDRAEFQLKLDQINASRVQCEEVKAPPPVEVSFFERPVVMFVTGALLGGVLTYTLVRVFQ